MPVTSRTFSAKSDKLLRDEKLGSVVLRLMMAVNDIAITSYSIHEWEHSNDPKKKGRWRGGLLYFGRIQSAHLFEALSIIQEIKRDGDLLAAVSRADSMTQKSFATVASFIGSADHHMLAKMRNNIAFHYARKLPIQRLKKIVDQAPDHSMLYSLGSEVLDWHFTLGDLVTDEIVIRDIFDIPPAADIQTAALEVLDRLRTIALAFMDFSGYFVRACCVR